MNILLDTFPHVRLLNTLQPKVFGCTVFVYNHSPNRGKLGSKALKCVSMVTLLLKKGISVIAPLKGEMTTAFLYQCHSLGRDDSWREPLGSKHSYANFYFIQSSFLYSTSRDTSTNRQFSPNVFSGYHQVEPRELKQSRNPVSPRAWNTLLRSCTRITLWSETIT